MINYLNYLKRKRKLKQFYYEISENSVFLDGDRAIDFVSALSFSENDDFNLYFDYLNEYSEIFSFNSPELIVRKAFLLKEMTKLLKVVNKNHCSPPKDFFYLNEYKNDLKLLNEQRKKGFKC